PTSESRRQLPGHGEFSSFTGIRIGRATAELFAVNGCRVLAVELPRHGLGEAFLDDPSFREFWDKKAPMGRLGEAQDVARAALFLATEDTRFVSGAGLLVDGAPGSISSWMLRKRPAANERSPTRGSHRSCQRIPRAPIRAGAISESDRKG
ncbi:MAG: SDR family oxidoreductase, partial [Pseudomonadales bacterium]